MYLVLVVPSSSTTIACGDSTSYLNKCFAFVRSSLTSFLSTKSFKVGNLHGSVEMLIKKIMPIIPLLCRQFSGPKMYLCVRLHQLGIATVMIPCETTQTKL